MDNALLTLTDRHQSTNVNGSTRRNSPIPSSTTMSPAGRPTSLMDSNQQQNVLHIVQVVVNRDDRGYGMKVSGDNPVYVQSVKEGGAAEKAGLHAGDKIIKVNDVNVITSKHTDVVDLIRSSSSVVLTVQQQTTSKKNQMMGSPSLHNNRSPITPSNARITSPQPVDNEKQYQLQLEKEQHYKLMIEKEQRYIDLLRSQLAASPDEKKYSELSKTEKNLQTLQAMLQRSQSEQSPPSLLNSPPYPNSNFSLNPLSSPNGNTSTNSNGTKSPTSPPPPLPKRNQQRPLVPPSPNHHHHSYMNNSKIQDANALFLNNEINANVQQRKRETSKNGVGRKRTSQHLVDNSLYSRIDDDDDHPPPLPPRVPLSPPNNNNPSNSIGNNEPDAVNSINTQMSYPLVATCATLVNDYSPNNPTHHRTKSSPESLTNLSTVAESSSSKNPHALSSSSPNRNNKMTGSESLNDLTQQEWNERSKTPPGTPPPPYPSPTLSRRRPYMENGGENNAYNLDETVGDCSSPDSPFRSSGANRNILANSSPIRAANPQIAQQPIISMEDDEISDQEMLEDHGYFKSLSRLWEHLPHLAVFMNYILSNSDPNSLLFYLLTDLYKEGNAKEMRKWAFEIHSCFLVPGAPLRLCNVDENIAREIDDVLTREYDKEEILRKIFWKSRSRAKEELTKQLADFQQKRTAGLGTIFGPTDQMLAEIYNDKAKETKLYENLFLEKLDPYLDEIEKEHYDPKRYYAAAALTTVLTRIFGLRSASHHILDRCPTFVSKEKSFRTKFMGKYSRKLNIQGHHFFAQQYYTVILCNNCHQIIFGLGPQGYQCSVCLINLHRLCVKLFDDTCPGPMNKKDRGIGKFIRIRSEPNDHRRKHSATFIQMEKERRQAEEKDNSLDLNESGENKPSQPVSRSGSDRRPDVVREEISTNKNLDTSSSSLDHHDKLENDSNASDQHSTNFVSPSNKKRATSNINRSESVKEQTEKRNKQRRNISDPSQHKTSGDVELDQPGLSHTDSGSSSNSSIQSYNDRLSESPCNSVDVVGDASANAGCGGSDWESDADMEPGSWQKLFPEEELRNLQPQEKKRQDIINELFHTESTHVRNLRVLNEIFYKTLHDSQILKPDELALIFPNIKEVCCLHMQFSKEMKHKRREDPLVGNLGDMLCQMFGGNSGEMLQKAAAIFCERQQLALEFIKDRRRRDTRFDTILLECEKRRQCRRLPLQGILPTEMQRLSKYPLLLERLISSTVVEEEVAQLKRAHELSKEILNYVNEETKLALNRARLEEIQKRLDTSNFEQRTGYVEQEFKNFDLTKYKLIREGNMQLRRTNKATITVHVLILEEAVVLLTKEGDRFLLKFFQSGTTTQPHPLSPIIKMSSLLVRTNASSRNALFLVNTSTNNIQMYDLSAEDELKRDAWVKHFSDAADAHNKREGKTKRPEPPPDSDESETVQDLPSTKDVAERAETVVDVGNNVNSNNNNKDNNSSNNNNTNINEEDDDEQVFIDAQDAVESKDNATTTAESSEGGGGVHHTTKVTPDKWPLIQPSQVHVEVQPVHTAESRLTPLEQIRRKDEEVKKALEDKQSLVADLLNIPHEHFELIADMASQQDVKASKDLTERVLAAIYQVNQLNLAVNKALNVTETQAVSATGGKHPSCQSQQENGATATTPPMIPAHHIKDIADSLTAQLTTLLSDVKQCEDERDILRKELHKTRERLHEQEMIHGGTVTLANNEDNDETSATTPEMLDLDSSQERPTESES